MLGPYDENPSSINKENIDSWVKEGVIEYIQPTNDVRPYIANCSVLVLPSYREGVPRSVMEAMAMERPIIVTDVPGCRETIIDGKNGFLVPVRDSDALAEAMERFIHDSKLALDMGKSGRELVAEKFDVFKVNKDIIREMGLAS